GDERRAHRDFGLAEADIAADDPVHGAVARKIREHLADGLGLILRLLEWERVGEGLILAFVERELQPLLRLASRIEVQELRGDIADLIRGALAGLGPLVRAELVQRRALGRGTG